MKLNVVSSLSILMKSESLHGFIVDAMCLLISTFNI